LIFAIIGFIGIGASVVQADLFRPVLLYYKRYFFVFAGVAKWGGEFADRVATSLAASSDARNQTLSEIKDDLKGLLRNLEKSILVVMDDIDRLSSDEIKLLFQLIKANADFPNVVYLLLFQRDIVEKSLESSAPLTGQDFLEKIVQVGFNIPQIERARLEKVLYVMTVILGSIMIFSSPSLLGAIRLWLVAPNFGEP